MIISDRHEFAFVHIPKCAGSAIKARIIDYDDLHGRFTERVDNHPELGSLDYGHMPLFTLRDHFPEEFERVKRYWSFAVLRDPGSRFMSAVSQRLKMYRNTYLHAASDEELIREIEDIKAELLSRSGRLPPQLIHFQRQIDYIHLDGQQVIDRLYSSKQVDQLLSDLAARIGVDCFPNPPKEDIYADNKSFVFKNETMRVIVEGMRPAALSILNRLPEAMKRGMRSALYTNPKERFGRIAEKAQINAFIDDYYAADLAMVEKVERRSN